MRPPLILLVGSSLGSGLLFAALPSEGMASAVRLLALLPLQLAALLWVLPRMR
ncbi:hypothetical protein [Synechococcus sp. CBW1004]|uniref:hypothetical protein n=1 Tax=Synechococcus sp. CBW1004 TaxID=1353136 RepID=UPI001E4F8A89|nr:hypothetical protein [Synechococcus sp. CBW1004]